MHIRRLLGRAAFALACVVISPATVAQCAPFLVTPNPIFPATSALRIDASEIEGLGALAGSKYPGTANHGVFRGRWRGRDVFVKLPRSGSGDTVLREVFLTRLLGRLGMGPELLGVTLIDGHVGPVTEFITGDHFFECHLKRGGDDPDKLRALERLEQLRRLNVIPLDAQFRRDVAGIYWVIDPGSYLVHDPAFLREIEDFKSRFPYGAQGRADSSVTSTRSSPAYR